MKAVRKNKEYTISEAEKDRYVKDGFDIVGDDGEVVEYGAGKTVPYNDYMKVVKENEQLKAQIAAPAPAEAQPTTEKPAETENQEAETKAKK